ncbi:MAG: phosphate ABC transporter permease family protein, partial [Paracoccaceae bacterium]
MPLIWLIALVLIIAAAGYVMGRSRAVASAGGDTRVLHSLPSYYGNNVALTVITPAFGVLVLWLLAQPLFIQNSVGSMIPESAMSEGATLDLVMSDVRRVSDGLTLLADERGLSESDIAALSNNLDGVRKQLGDVGVALGSDVEPAVFEAAQSYREMSRSGTRLMWVAVLVAALIGFGISYAVTNKDFRARNTVERGILMVLIAAASIAILTTLGIVLSMLFETRNFFADHPWTDFFFGLNWAPDFRGNSELAILPLLWGTLYISFIALLVAVPIGLFAAIYLSEYA